MSRSVLSCLLPLLLAPFFSFCLQIMPSKGTKSSFATPARKLTRRVKSSQGSAVVVEQPQPQELSAEVLPHALLEEIIDKVSDEVTRRLSSTSGKRRASDGEILDRSSVTSSNVFSGR